jgi:hypothetical protein
MISGLVVLGSGKHRVHHAAVSTRRFQQEYGELRLNNGTTRFHWGNPACAASPWVCFAISPRPRNPRDDRDEIHPLLA